MGSVLLEICCLASTFRPYHDSTGRPQSTPTDPKDWYLFDLLFEARTDALVTQDWAVLRAGKALGLPVLHPRDLRAVGLI